MNVNILEISKLKYRTEIGEFNSDDYYIYYCGQKSLRRNGVDKMVNKSPKCSTSLLAGQPERAPWRRRALGERWGRGGLEGGAPQENGE